MTITIIDYHPDTQRFQLSVTQQSSVRGYIDDIDSTYQTEVEYAEVTPSPIADQPNRLVFVRVDGEPIVAATVFETAITRPIKTEVSRDNPCHVAFEIEFWVTAGTEENQLSCSRYTQMFRLTFENHLAVPVQIRMLPVGSSPANGVFLNPGQAKDGVELRDLPPGTQVCDFRILYVDPARAGP